MAALNQSTSTLYGSRTYTVYRYTEGYEPSEKYDEVHHIDEPFDYKTLLPKISGSVEYQSTPDHRLIGKRICNGKLVCIIESQFMGYATLVWQRITYYQKPENKWKKRVK